MKSVKTSELKANLAKYLGLVRRGETIEVLDRGQPIAIIRGANKLEGLATDLPLKAPQDLGKLKSDLEKVPSTDVVRLLLEDRRK